MSHDKDQRPSNVLPFERPARNQFRPRKDDTSDDGQIYGYYLGTEKFTGAPVYVLEFCTDDGMVETIWLGHTEQEMRTAAKLWQDDGHEIIWAEPPAPPEGAA